MTYESSEKILFSADGFGKSELWDVEEDWACESRRYLLGNVGKIRQAGSGCSRKAPSWTLKKSVRSTVLY